LTWSIQWSWQAPQRVATIAACEGGVVVSSGLDVVMLEGNGDVRWSIELPFKVHAAAAVQGAVGVLAAHAFYLLGTQQGEFVHEGRTTPGGFLDLLPRPGGGWVLACRRGQLHLFSAEGRGLRRMESGLVRRLVGWFDREHLLWQDMEGRLCCGRLTGDDRMRRLDERPWSWVSALHQGKLLLQGSDGGLWEGIPHPFGWDQLERIEGASMEPMAGVRAGDGWWVLGIEGRLTALSALDASVEADGEVSEGDPSVLTSAPHFGDLLVLCTPDSMMTCTRDGLLRQWSAPHLHDAERQGRYKAAAEAALARDWDERRALFTRARDAEDLGKLSMAIELYEALGRTVDVKRLLRRQKEGGE